MAKSKNCFYQDCDKGTKKKKKKKKYPKSARVDYRGDYWLRKGRRGIFALGHLGHGHDHDHSGGDMGGDMGGGDGGGGMGESFKMISELLDGNIGQFSANTLASANLSDNMPRGHKLRKAFRMGRYPSDDEYEEDAEVTPQTGSTGVVGGQSGNKIDQARQLFQSLVNRPDMNRQAMIQQFQDQVGVTSSTAVSYYERLAKEAGMTNNQDKQDVGAGVDMRGAVPQGQPVEELPADTEIDLQDEVEYEDEDRAGVIRTVDGAHLIYKRQTEDGSFEELWIYNTGNSINSELDIRRDILAGTDIPPQATQSEDGSQYYTISTLGNAQYVNVKGLPN